MFPLFRHPFPRLGLSRSDLIFRVENDSTTNRWYLISPFLKNKPYFRMIDVMRVERFLFPTHAYLPSLHPLCQVSSAVFGPSRIIQRQILSPSLSTERYQIQNWLVSQGSLILPGDRVAVLTKQPSPHL